MADNNIHPLVAGLHGEVVELEELVVGKLNEHVQRDAEQDARIRAHEEHLSQLSDQLAENARQDTARAADLEALKQSVVAVQTRIQAIKFAIKNGGNGSSEPQKSLPAS